jgi:hypothetical protein
VWDNRRRAAGERGQSHGNHLPGPNQVGFLSAVLTRLARTEGAFMAVLKVNDGPVAAQAFLEIAGRLTVYYSGFDPHS